MSVRRALLTSMAMVCVSLSSSGFANTPRPKAGAPRPSIERPLLASELVHDDIKSGYHFSIWIDPYMSKAPELVRKLRQDHMPVQQGERCSKSAQCYVAYRANAFSYRRRLISGIGKNIRYDGAAHPIYDLNTILYDATLRRHISFSSLFSNWVKAAQILQKQWCNAMETHSTCPPFQHQALALMEERDGITHIRVETEPGAFGTYAEGADIADLEVTDALLAVIKPEFRDMFLLRVR